MSNNHLTDQQFWDEYWQGLTLPSEVTQSNSTPLKRAILQVFDEYLPVNPAWTVAEIGGAPGQFLAYIHRNFEYSPHSLDYSAVGCELTQQNFAALNLPIQVHQHDLFADESTKIGPFDVVYSLGFIEHFQDPAVVVGHHLKLLRPDGILLIGVPNYAGIYGPLLSTLTPQRLALHNLQTMQSKSWERFEKEYGLNVLFRGYIGGFEPAVLTKFEERNLQNRLIASAFSRFGRLYSSKLNRLRTYNSFLFSGYLIGVYKAGKFGG